MVRILLSIVLALLLGPVFCFYSSGIEMGNDDSQVDTVGEITRNGFPIWCKENAPGFSIVDGMHFDRLEIDLAFWILVVFGVMLALFRLRRGKRS
jgi:hypothetical protein